VVYPLSVFAYSERNRAMGALTIEQARSRLGVATRRGTEHDQREAAKVFAEARITSTIQRTTDLYGPIDVGQAERIVAVLRTAVGGGA
jgi:hypothetical protein